MAAPQALNMYWDPNSSVGSLALPPIRSIHAGATRVRDAVMWMGTATSTANGNLVANITLDGTATGAALFSNVYAVMAIHQLNTTTPTQACFAIYRGIAAMKQATFLVIGNNTLVLGGNSFAAAGAGQSFSVIAFGVPA